MFILVMELLNDFMKMKMYFILAYIGMRLSSIQVIYQGRVKELVAIKVKDIILILDLKGKDKLGIMNISMLVNLYCSQL